MIRALSLSLIAATLAGCDHSNAGSRCEGALRSYARVPELVDILTVWQAAQAPGPANSDTALVERDLLIVYRTNDGAAGRTIRRARCTPTLPRGRVSRLIEEADGAARPR